MLFVHNHFGEFLVTELANILSTQFPKEKDVGVQGKGPDVVGKGCGLSISVPCSNLTGASFFFYQIALCGLLYSDPYVQKDTALKRALDPIRARLLKELFLVGLWLRGHLT